MSMFDRVARAIHAALPVAAGGPLPVPWDDLDDDQRAPYAAAAHRVIAAMRVPTDAMLEQGTRRDLAQDVANIWERMVFTALSDGR